MGSPNKSGRARRAAAIAAVALTATGCGILGGGSPRNLDVISVSSPRFRDGAPLPHGYSCNGGMGNPPLRWSGTSGAKSVALVVDDNSPRSEAEVHWVVFNIDPNTTELGENGVPRGARQGQTTTGKVGYVPPCATEGNYRFTVYALDAKLDLQQGSALADTLQHIADHTIARGRLTAANIE
ncbi:MULTISPECIES: YbhB/YbcL family Raf kinase inhibitor-like protein [Microtetraspora]|uniref:YbhB/YbcL family Raf kinase inhibitor-like protein n=1 Tax=Microtetraspora glauca TaxID=1996 RepID=A0ABV3G8G2_MICGL|nr:YbhB/YbcL family Raf kinase inhibitor-like protein [Microtetraspora sp. AC03309]MCC5580785.1 YbhB/YbcL family Raf kinase inhibitor-like protein [Microtetraspora sp. AC03309]